MNEHSKNILQVFDQILNEKQCRDLSYENKFIQRSSSKLQGHEFIKVMILPSEGVSEDSLDGLCKRIRRHNSEADISAQALSERINSCGAASLIKDVFFRILSHVHKVIGVQSPSLMKALGGFSSVLLEDSTVIELNEKVYKYQGTNRNRVNKSQVKIDLIHELFSNQIVDVQLESGKVPDQALSYRILNFIKEGDLIIRDLGYFVLPTLKAIICAGAYFLSRLLPNVKVYLNQNDIKPVDLAKYVSKKCKKISFIDLEVFLGDLKVPARLVIFRAPKEVVVVRLTNAKKRIRDTGRVMSKGKKFSMDFSAFVTNVSVDMLAAEMIGTVYQLRWEIELIFKQWKSQLKMDVLEGVHHNRIECLIWGRLCMVLLLALISQEFGKVAEQLGRELSIVKLIKYVMRANEFVIAVQNNKIEKYMDDMTKDLIRMLCKNKRTRKTMRKRVVENCGYYGAQPVDLQCVA